MKRTSAFTALCLASSFLFWTAAPASAGLFGSSSPEYSSSSKGSFLEQIEKGKDFPSKPYTPPNWVTSPFGHSQFPPEVAWALSNNVNFVDSYEAQNLAQSVVDRMLAVWGGPHPDVKVMITGEAAYGGRANPSGRIFLSIGTFNPDATKGVASLDELALLLGHELGHLLLKHLDHAEDMQKLADGVGYAATGFIAFSAVRNSQMTGSGMTVAGDAHDVAMGLVGGLAASMLLSDMMEPSWGRDNEFDADKIGVDLARRAGFNVGEDEYIQFVKKHTDEQAESSARMARLSTLLKAMAGAQAAPQMAPVNGAIPSMPAILDLVVSKTVDGVFSELAKSRKEHPSAADRSAELKTYFGKVYPDPDATPDGRLLKHDVQGLAPVSNSAPFRNLLARVTAANHDMMDITEVSLTAPAAANAGGNATGLTALPVALAARAQSIAQSTEPPAPKKGGRQSKSSKTAPPAEYGVDSAPMTWSVMGQLLSLTGRTDAARQAWESGVRSRWATVDMLRSLGQNYARNRNDPRLPMLINDVTTRMGSEGPVLDLIVAQKVAAGDIAGAEVSAAECYAYDDHRFYPSCAAYLGYDPTVKGVEAHTEPGKKAFRDKASGKGLTDMFSPLHSIFN